MQKMLRLLAVLPLLFLIHGCVTQIENTYTINGDSNAIKATDDIIHGDIKAAIAKCCSRWASLPGAEYGQHEHKIAPLIAAFKAAGGAVV